MMRKNLTQVSQASHDFFGAHATRRLAAVIDAEAASLALQRGMTIRRQEPGWCVLARSEVGPMLARGDTWEEAFARLDARAAPPETGPRQPFLPGLFGGT